MIWEPFAMALVLGLLMSAGLYFAYLWPSVEPDEDELPAPEAKATVKAEAKTAEKPESAKPEPVKPEPATATVDKVPEPAKTEPATEEPETPPPSVPDKPDADKATAKADDKADA